MILKNNFNSADINSVIEMAWCDKTRFDIVSDKIDKINDKISPIDASHISAFLKNKNLNLIATSDQTEALEKSD